MLTKEQLDALREAAKDEDAEKLGSVVVPLIQAAADSVVADQLEGIKKNRDEFRADLDKFKPFGKPEEIQAQLDELKTLRAAKGKKPDQKELAQLVEAGVEDRIGAFRQEQETLRASIEGERDEVKALAERAVNRLLEMHRRSQLLSHAGDGLKPLMAPYWLQRVGPMLKPIESANGSPWWDKEPEEVQWQVVNPETGSPLTGGSGNKTPGELVADGRAGLGEEKWNSKEFAETFWRPKGKGGGYVAPGQTPVAPSGHVDPSASSYDHFGALYGDQ